ncbi:MAG: hypothetical protein KatS3mg027_0442 [Bacteroidia bacterium]|nr:MAG: hypothetical protein KatS3mg027_0442 [Bacteroidia bacterium]
MKKSTVFVLCMMNWWLISCEHSTDKKSKELSSEKSNNTASSQTSKDSCAYYLKLSQSIDSTLLKSTTYDEALAINANNTFVKCALLCQHDSISPLYLIKAAQLSQTLKKIEMSEKYLNKIIDTYPKSKFIPAAKFLLAQYYADTKLLNQPGKAKELLNDIIREYPQTVWAENAAAALQWVGKSDEEILKSLKKKK